MSKGSDPAYPVKCDKDDFLRVADNHFGGLTKREVAAFAALGGILSNRYWSEYANFSSEAVARDARIYADALLSELEKTP